MGIANITPDSFFDKGRYFSCKKAVKHIQDMLDAGANIIDIGAESTRPGAEYISLEEEQKRIFPVVKEVLKSKKVFISIDTNKAAIAEKCLSIGASMINDVSALRKDPAMVKVVAEHEVPVILMHALDDPKAMQDNPTYKNVVSQIIDFFKERVDFALSHGIKKEKIYLDPGIGFGKNLEHNFSIIRCMEKFTELGLPLVIGASRKSFIGKNKPEERLIGSITTAVVAAMKGASVVRVHDVKETVDALKMVETLIFPPVKGELKGV